jgi:lysophospholipase L1-like esterase
LSAPQKEVKVARKPYFYNLLTGIYSKLPLSSEDILFVGDSHIKLCPWSELFQNPRIKNRGIDGDTASGVFERADQLVQAQPAKVIMMIGTNDINKGLEVQLIISHYKNLITLIRQKSPSTQFFILSVLPFEKMHPGYRIKNQKVRELNHNLKTLSNSSDIFFIDLYKLLVDENKNLDNKYSYDKLHLNEDGYMIVKNALEQHVK